MKAWIWLCLCLPATVLHARQDEPPRRLSRQQEDGQAEMLRLFGEVEQQLKAIDKLLSDAAAGDTKKLRDAGLSSMDELLRQTADNSRKVQADIDRLLDLARQAGQQGGGGGGGSSSGSSGGQGQGQQDGDGSSSPLSGRSEQSTQREATPEGPGQGAQRPQAGQEQGGQQQGGQQENRAGEQQGQRPTPGGQSRPRDPRQAGADAGTSRPGSDPGGDPLGAGSKGSDGADRWGDLPVHARDVFRTQGGRDMPPRYRDAIDGYYRRLSKNP